MGLRCTQLDRPFQNWGPICPELYFIQLYFQKHPGCRRGEGAGKDTRARRNESRKKGRRGMNHDGQRYKLQRGDVETIQKKILLPPCESSWKGGSMKTRKGHWHHPTNASKDGGKITLEGVARLYLVANSYPDLRGGTKRTE